MADQSREKPVPVKKGSTGPRQTQPPQGAMPQQPQSQEDLDARQERIRPTRRRGPELPPGPATRTSREALRPDVPPTECDEEGEEER